MIARLGPALAAVFLLSLLRNGSDLLIPLTAVSQGIGPAAIGALMSSAFLLPVLLAVPLGRKIHRLPPGLLVAASIGVFAAAGLLVTMTENVAALIAFQLVTGTAHLAGLLTLQSHVATSSRIDSRARDFGWFSTFQSLGQLAGPLAAGVAFDLLPGQLSFALIAVAGVVAMPVGFLLRRDQQSQSAAGQEWPMQRMTSLFRVPGVNRSLLSGAISLGGIGALQTFLPVLLTARGYEATAIAALLSMRAFASVAVRPFLGGLDRRAPRSGLLTALLVAFGLGLFGYVFDLGYIWYMAICLLLGVSSGVIQPLAIVMLVDAVQGGVHGTALGIRITANRLAQFLSPLLLGLVAGRTGTPGAFVAAAAIALLSSLIVALDSRRAPSEDVRPRVEV